MKNNLVVRCHAFSINGTQTSGEKESLIIEVAHCKDEKILNEIVEIQLMSELFVSAAKGALFYLVELPKKVKGRFVERTAISKYHKDFFPDDVWKSIPSEQQITIKGGLKIIKKGDFLIVSTESKLPAEKVLGMLKAIGGQHPQCN